MALLQDALAHHAKFVAEHWRRKALAPYLFVNQFDELGGVVRIFQRAIGFDDALFLLLAQPLAPHGFEGCCKGVEGIGAQRQTRSHCVPTEFIDQRRVAF